MILYMRSFGGLITKIILPDDRSAFQHAGIFRLPETADILRAEIKICAMRETTPSPYAFSGVTPR
jgi:hypothetical protein